MKINGYEKVLVCREIIKRDLRKNYSELYKDGCDLNRFLNCAVMALYLRDKTLEDGYRKSRFYDMVLILIQTEKYVDKSSEARDTKKVMNKLFGENLVVPEKYRGAVERLRTDFSRHIYRWVKNNGEDIAGEDEVVVPCKQLQYALSKSLSDRAFRETSPGKIENIHTNEIISFDDEESIRTIILDLQKIAREESIDALLDEESIREELGIDIVSYEVAGLESIRQNTLNQIRDLHLGINQIPSKLPDDMEDQVYAVMSQQLQALSGDIKEYNSQIKSSDGVTAVYPYKTRVYHRQSWNKAYK